MLGKQTGLWGEFVLCVALVFAVCVTVQPAAAQSTQGSILGNVSDTTGAVITGVTVKMTNVETGLERVVTTDELGNYDAAHLEAGKFRVTAETAGFKTFVRENVFLDPNQKVRIDITMEIGDVTERVEVEAASPVIKTDQSDVDGLVNERMLRDVVMGGRGTFNWVLQAAGTFYGRGYTFNGSRMGAMSHDLDGVETADPRSGTQYSPMRPDQEMVREVRIQAVNSTAEFSSSATIVQTTMNGTNDFHGQMTWNHINGALSARNFFSAQRSKSVINNWYTSHGGPIIKNKTFFFAHYDGQTRPSTSPRTENTPTLAMRQGDYGACVAAEGCDPITDPTTGQPFANNMIPQGRIAQSALAYQDRFFILPEGPEANNPSPSRNFNREVPVGRADWAYSARVDHQFSDKNNFFARIYWSHFGFKNQESNLPPEFAGIRFRVRDTTPVVFSDTHVISPTTINEFRLGFVRIDWPLHSQFTGMDLVNEFGLTGYPRALDPAEFGGPSVSISGLKGISIQNTSKNVQHNWDIRNNITMIRGNHNFKVGFNIRSNFNSAFPASPSAQFGSFSFNGQFTGEPHADFLLGIPRTASTAVAVDPYNLNNVPWAVFLQDDWKLTPRLTFNWGIRYENFGVYTEEGDRIHNFDPATGSVVVPNESARGEINPLFPSNIPVSTAAEVGFPERSLVHRDNNDVAPRIGFAYRSGLSDLVFRGGFGVFYNFEARKRARQMTSGPFTASEVFDNSITDGVPLWQWPQTFPSGPARSLGTQSINAINVDRQSSYLYQWNFTLEKQVGEFGLRASYIGINGFQLPYRHNINQPFASTIPFSQDRRPYPFVRNIDFFDRGANQHYHSFQAEVRRRWTNGLTLVSHYTTAKNLTDSEDSSVEAPIEDAYNREREWGREFYNVRHRWITTWVWEIPVGRGLRYMGDAPGAVDAILGGWRISGNLAANTGYFFTPTFSGRDISNTNVTSGRPDRICDGNLGDARTFQRDFDVSCFVRPAAGSGRFGNSGRAIIESRPWTGVSFGLFKYFTIKENWKIRLNGHFMNTLNHPKHGGRSGRIGLDIGRANAGVLSSTDSSHSSNDIWPNRQIELGLRMEW